MWPYYFPELVPTSTFTTTQLVTTTFTNSVDVYCLAYPPELTNCITRQRRAVLEENDFVYIKGQPIRPSEVSRYTHFPVLYNYIQSLIDVFRMTMTEMPIMNVDKSEMLVPSIEIDEDRVRDGRMFKKNNWFYATTQTVTLTVVTVVNSTMLPTLPISIAGCIPNCLTSIPIC